MLSSSSVLQDLFVWIYGLETFWFFVKKIWREWLKFLQKPSHLKNYSDLRALTVGMSEYSLEVRNFYSKNKTSATKIFKKRFSFFSIYFVHTNNPGENAV